jgi:acetolactate synthase-1/2/3 large subunit
MFTARETQRAVHALTHTRALSSSAPRFAVSPYRKATAAVVSKKIKEIPKRPQSTAATATTTAQEPRARPSPAFNRENDWNEVQPLRPFRQAELDHSFVGMTGGEIFHEMMLRQGVKHICMLWLDTANLPLLTS